MRERVLILQLDGKIPNLALLRIAHHHRALGDLVTLRAAGNWHAVEPRLDEPEYQRVYASAIFERTKPLAERVRQVWPGAVIGGTGVDPGIRLSDAGIADDGPADYSDHPQWTASIGFTQRGCRLKCGFCVVPRKEGKVHAGRTIAQIWRGDPWPRHIVLLDNDFFGHPQWRERVAELNDGGFRTCLTQGINARMLDEETAAALASLDCYDVRMRVKRLYTALDNPRDTGRFLRGLELLKEHGVPARQVMVYMLVGYWPGETHADREKRLRTIRSFGARPYPMPFRRTAELVGFQRWVIGGYDHGVPWDEWKAARYKPERLKRIETGQERLAYEEGGDDEAAAAEAAPAGVGNAPDSGHAAQNREETDR